MSEQLEAPHRKSKAAPSFQIQLFEPVGHQIAARIRALNIDNLKPLEALQILNDLKEELKGE